MLQPGMKNAEVRKSDPKENRPVQVQNTGIKPQ